MSRKSKKISPFTALIKLFVFGVVFAGAYIYSSGKNIDSKVNEPVTSKVSAVPSDYVSKVIRVVDGDTIKLSSGITVRYIGIDTPETKIKKDGHFVKEPQPYGKEAYEYNRKLVEGKAVRLEFDRVKNDKYGRSLAYCYVDDININARMIEQGYACVFTMPPNVKYAKDFTKLQQQAMAAKRGMWGAYPVIGAKEASVCVNQIRAVRDRVRSVSSSKTMVYLRLGEEGSYGFEVAIYRKDLSYFRAQDIDPEKFYLNKVIEVSGRIRMQDNAQIIVSSPDNIDVIDEGR